MQGSIRIDEHVEIDLVYAKLKPRTQVLVKTITYFLCSVGCLVVAWYSIQSVWYQFQSGILIIGGDLELPAAPITVFIPIGYFLLFIEFVGKTYGYLRNRGT